MTEAEWLACCEQTQMLEFLEKIGSNRKLSLFAYGCCERISHCLTDARRQSAVAALSQWADGQAAPEEMERVGHDANDAAENAAGKVCVGILGFERYASVVRMVGQFCNLGLETAQAIEAAVNADPGVNAHRAAESAVGCGRAQPQHT